MTEKKYMFEDFHTGRVFEGGPKLVVAEEIIKFATEFDPQPMHLSEEAGKASILGGLAASGWHTNAMMMRLMCDTFLNDTAGEGSPGVESLDWKRPVLAGDSLMLRTTIGAVKPLRSKPGVGMVTFLHEVRNQRGEIVVQAENPAMVRMRASVEA